MKQHPRVSIFRFLNAEDGAVTVDWVVLTAFVVGMVSIIYVALEENTLTLADNAANAVATEDDGFAAE